MARWPLPYYRSRRNNYLSMNKVIDHSTLSKPDPASQPDRADRPDSADRPDRPDSANRPKQASQAGQANNPDTSLLTSSQTPPEEPSSTHKTSAERSGGLFYFDKADHSLVQMVNTVLNLPPGEISLLPLSNLFDPALHPNGIKRLAVSREERIAYAVVNLLELLEEGSRAERLGALQTLHDEVLYSAVTEFRTNTGRVLIQIMKDLVRSKGNDLLQVKLAHDFRIASSGNPRIVRKLLERYNLLEMPENGSQITFDNHVHDSSTKGRKTPTHLIMDAWVKGIKALTVIYYNHVEPGPAYELMEAAKIMDIHVRVGIEFNCSFYDKRSSFIWSPHHFASSQEFVDFLHKPQIAHLMKAGLEASLFRESIIFELLENFNLAHHQSLNSLYELNSAPLDRDEFDRFVGAGQASRLHLSEFIYRKMLPHLEKRCSELIKEQNDPATTPERQAAIKTLLLRLDSLTPEDIEYGYLTPAANPTVPDPDNPSQEIQLPSLLRNNIYTMVSWVSDLHPNRDIVLTLSGIAVEDVLEILYDCQGMITHIELFNYKDYIVGNSPQIKQINQIQTAINSGNAIAIKRIIRRILRILRADTQTDPKRVAKFERILRSIPKLQSFYVTHPLGSRLGSDSTSRSKRFFGMGLAFTKTLPLRARQAIALRRGLHLVLPVHSVVYPRVDYLPKKNFGLFTKWLAKKLAHIPILPDRFNLNYQKARRWVVNSESSVVTSHGNLITLGSTGSENPVIKKLLPAKDKKQESLGKAYLNTHLKNALKVLLGLTVASATFMYTQNWWLLAYFGGAIWLAITLNRNIAQAVLGGGGFRRPNTLHWSEYVNWNRVADSLFYTGFSVPLLELLIRVLILQDIVGVNAETNPVLVYTTMSLANGLYIASHNIYRGLPKEAAIGNLFRSALAIPTAIFISSAATKILGFAGAENAQLMVIQGSSIISKLSSDTVAALIEGFADRTNNRRNRFFDYSHKLKQLYDAFVQMELLFPEQDVLDLLEENAQSIKSSGPEVQALERTIIINALDLMYFWFYQPRAIDALKYLLRQMTPEERSTLLRSQNVLTREKEISLMIVDGMLGRNFSKALTFYLGRWQQYLTAMEALIYRKN